MVEEKLKSWSHWNTG